MCKFPTCTRKEEKDGYCFLHKIYSGSEPSKKKGIANMSKKRSDLQKEYRKLVDRMLKENNKCEVKSPICTGKAQGLNHKQKRTEKNLCDESNVERCCNACNLFIEENPDWAQENGHQISRFKNRV